MGQFPAAALLGPRQVGKTTLALSLTNEAENSPLYLDLELPSDGAKLADPELYLSSYEDRLVILGEIHRLPGIFQPCVVRSTAESERGNAPTSSFYSDRPLLTPAAIGGDACGENRLDPTDSIPRKGRGCFSPNASQALWIRGGFPDTFPAKTESQSYEWRAGSAG